MKTKTGFWMQLWVDVAAPDCPPAGTKLDIFGDGKDSAAVTQRSSALQRERLKSEPLNWTRTQNKLRTSCVSVATYGEPQWCL